MTAEQDKTQDSQIKTARTGSLRQIVMKKLPRQDCQTGQPGQDSQNSIAIIGRAEKDSYDDSARKRRARKKQPE
jgi:hypothetical protein